MRNAVLVSIVVIGVLLTGCYQGVPGLFVAGSGRVVTQKVDVTDFDSIEAGGAFNVDVVRGEDFEVVLTADDNLISHVRATKNGSTLQLGLEPGFAAIYGLRTGTLEARITMPDLHELRLSGASHGNVEGFTRDMDIKLSGASWLKGTLAAGSLHAEASGASHANLEGSAEDIALRGSGASQFDMHDLRAGNADVTLSSASSARVQVKGKIDYSVSSGSQLEYTGDPRIGETEVSSGASVRSR